VERVYALIEERARQPVHAAAIHAYVCGLIAAADLEAARRRAGPAPTGGAGDLERRVARPSSERRGLRDRMDARYHEGGLARHREAAEAVYRRFAFGDSA
jgi:hypothetical protein